MHIREKVTSYNLMRKKKEWQSILGDKFYRSHFLTTLLQTAPELFTRSFKEEQKLPESISQETTMYLMEMAQL